jgi:hypothetical protein
MKKNAIFVLAGNCRTFIDCFDSLYIHVISKIFSEDFNIHVYMYLKLTDPGPKGQEGWNFKYKDVEHSMIIDKIQKIQTDYSTLNIEYKLLNGDEITDNELILQVKNRNLYYKHLGEDKKLARAMQCHYNFYRCGLHVLEKEKDIECNFDYIVYVRPDLFFTNSCNNINMYNNSIVTLGMGPNIVNNDHIAIIPRHHFNTFFFDRINTYRNNTTIRFSMPEEIYWNTIKFEVKKIGEYYIKRA